MKVGQMVFWHQKKKKEEISDEEIKAVMKMAL